MSRMVEGSCTAAGEGAISTTVPVKSRPKPDSSQKYGATVKGTEQEDETRLGRSARAWLRDGRTHRRVHVGSRGHTDAARAAVARGLARDPRHPVLLALQRKVQ